MADPSRTASVGDGLDGLKRVGLPASAHQRHVARRRDPASPFDHRRIGVDVEVVERDRLDSLIPEQPLRPLDMTDVLQTVVGDEEGLLESERARQHPEPLHGA